MLKNLSSLNSSMTWYSYCCEFWLRQISHLNIRTCPPMKPNQSWEGRWADDESLMTAEGVRSVWCFSTRIIRATWLIDLLGVLTATIFPPKCPNLPAKARWADDKWLTTAEGVGIWWMLHFFASFIYGILLQHLSHLNITIWPPMKPNQSDDDSERSRNSVGGAMIAGITHHPLTNQIEIMQT